jgi:hypothetical protein
VYATHRDCTEHQDIIGEQCCPAAAVGNTSAAEQHGHAAAHAAAASNAALLACSMWCCLHPHFWCCVLRTNPVILHHAGDHCSRLWVIFIIMGSSWNVVVLTAGKLYSSHAHSGDALLQLAFLLHRKYGIHVAAA